MNQAEALLASLADPYSLEESDVIIIDEDRKIHVPESMRRLGVQHDHNIETVTFECPRYWSGRDLSEMTVYINYVAANDTSGKYAVENVVVDEMTIHFDWIISSSVTKVKGPISFLICAVSIDEEGIETLHWNSEINRQCYITEGLECAETLVANYPDVITYLLTKLNDLEKNVNTGDNGHYLKVESTTGTMWYNIYPLSVNDD